MGRRLSYTVASRHRRPRAARAGAGAWRRPGGASGGGTAPLVRRSLATMRWAATPLCGGWLRWLLSGGAVGPILLIVGIGSLVSAHPFARVTYLCQGESPRPCTCFREDEAPAGFQANRLSEGPDAGFGTGVLLAFAAGLTALTVWGGARLAKVRSTGAGRLLPIIGALLILSAGVVWIGTARPYPCQDQGP